MEVSNRLAGQEDLFRSIKNLRRTKEECFVQGSLNYLFGGIKLDAKTYGDFEGFPVNSASSVGWCHIMTPVVCNL